MIRYFFLAFLFVYLFNGCKQKAMEPAYLNIDNFTVTTDFLTQGTASQNISEVLVYIDDQNAGVYHLPAKVPINNMTGVHKITLGPAVVENAIGSNKRYPYLFLEGFDTSITMEAGKTNMLKPRTKYRKTTQFVLIEDFENLVSIFSGTSYNDSIALKRDSIPANNLEKGWSASFELPANYQMEYATRSEYNLPTSSTSETFVEINYKSELPLAIGLYINEPSTIIKTGVVTLNAKSNWSKAYINLTEVVSVKPAGTKFKLFFNTWNSEASLKTVHIDNIKIIRFE